MYDALTAGLMLVVCMASAGFWWKMLYSTMRLDIKGTVVTTALLLAASVWLSMGYFLLLVGSDVATSTTWLRPAVGVYMVASVVRTSFYLPLIKQLIQ